MSSNCERHQGKHFDEEYPCLETVTISVSCTFRRRRTSFPRPYRSVIVIPVDFEKRTSLNCKVMSLGKGHDGWLQGVKSCAVAGAAFSGV